MIKSKVKIKTSDEPLRQHPRRSFDDMRTKKVWEIERKTKSFSPKSIFGFRLVHYDF